ncbi:hypothetical protein ENBRE01_0278 [Enteropsectra breve]|nr:hypothetical protein ENBRE01_0278 [Enteropsectra breve]
MVELSFQTVEQSMDIFLNLLRAKIANRPYLMRPDVLFWIRISFTVSCLVRAIIVFYIYFRVKKSHDKTVIKVPKTGLFVIPNTETVEMTVSEYDLSQAKNQIRWALLFPIAIALMHYKWGVMNFFVMQIVSLFKNLLFNPLYHAFLFNKLILRPYSKNMLFEAPEASGVDEIKDDEMAQKNDIKRKKED